MSSAVGSRLASSEEMRNLAIFIVTQSPACDQRNESSVFEIRGSTAKVSSPIAV